MGKAVEFLAVALLILCTVTLLLIRGTRVIVACSIRVVFVAAVVANTVSYVLGEIGVL